MNVEIGRTPKAFPRIRKERGHIQKRGIAAMREADGVGRGADL